MDHSRIAAIELIVKKQINTKCKLEITLIPYTKMIQHKEKG